MKTFLVLITVLFALSACDMGGTPSPPPTPPTDCVPGDNNCE